MRTPSASLVVDAAILLAAAHGKSRAALEIVSRRSQLITTVRAVEEVRRRLELGLRRPDLLPVLDALAAAITVEPLSVVAERIADAEAALRDAVPSRNGSTDDAHVLALAWLADADIWSPDRDFAGTGVASWSTPNLMRSLADPAGAS